MGVDPGSLSWDFVGFDEKTGIFLDHTIPTKTIQKDLNIFFEILNSSGPFDLISAPSGFGLPLKKICDLSEKDLFLTILKKNDNSENIVGLTNILKKLKELNVNGYILPGVKHLPTVPNHRKINKIDLGTADKLCTAVVGIRNQIENYNINANETCFIMVELGYAFNAILAVENGCIIDGIGGSNLMGFRAAGGLDAEIAYLMGKIKKSDIYKGGVSSIAGYLDLNAEEILLLSKKDEQTKLGLEAFYENIKKGVYSISCSFSSKSKIREILFAGRLARIEEITHRLFTELNDIAPSKIMKSYANISKESAQGAAFIANGLLGGQFKSIVETMKLKESSGSVLDNIFLPIENF